MHLKLEHVGVNSRGQQVELFRVVRLGHSAAESEYRIKVSGKNVYKGWAHDSFAEYKRLSNR